MDPYKQADSTCFVQFGLSSCRCPYMLAVHAIRTPVARGSCAPTPQQEAQTRQDEHWEHDLDLKSDVQKRCDEAQATCRREI